MLNKAFSKKVVCLVVMGSILSPTAAFANSISKDETVFTTLSADGTVKSQTVTDWIHSDSALGTVNDKSSLTNIKNLKGSETPQASGDTLVWNTNKNDIYYQGDTNKQLPISVKITYYLNDKEISAKDLAGKSGKVKIKIDLQNNYKHMVNVAGNARTIYAPIPVATVLMLPSDNFSSIKTNGATIIKAGNYNAVTFPSVPGLLDSLGIKNGDYGINLPDTLELTTDASNFTMQLPIYCVAAPNLIDLNKLAGAKNMDDIKGTILDAKSKLDKMHEGVNQLDSALKQYKEGIATLNTKVNNTGRDAKGMPTGLKLAESTFNGYIGQLGSALSQAKTGANQLYTQGVLALDYNINNTEVDENKKPKGLIAATNQLYDNIKAVNTNVNGVYDSNGNFAKNSDGTYVNRGFRNYISDIYGGITNDAGFNSKDPSKSDPNNMGVKGGLEVVKYGVDQIVDNPLIKGLLAAAGKSNDVAQLKAVIQQLLDNTKVTVKDGELDPNKCKTLADGAAVYNNCMKLFGDTAKSGMPDATKYYEAMHQLGNQIHTQLLPNYQQLNSGISQMSDLVNGQLVPGSSALNDNISLLGDTLNTKLLPYITQISDTVSSQLTPGVNEAYTKASPAISNVTDILAAKDEIVNIGKELNSFSGLGDNMEGSVKFIIQTSPILAGNADAKKAVKKEKKSFFKKSLDAFLK